LSGSFFFRHLCIEVIETFEECFGYSLPVNTPYYFKMIVPGHVSARFGAGNSGFAVSLASLRDWAEGPCGGTAIRLLPAFSAVIYSFRVQTTLAFGAFTSRFITSIT
jgi:hypothetical protein